MESRGHFLTPDRTNQSDSFNYTISPVEALPSHQKSSISRPSPPSQLSSSKLLKDLSSRVQGYLKESHKSVQFHEHKEDILILKKSNVQMQTVIDQFRGRTLSFQTETTPKAQPQSRIESSYIKIVEISHVNKEPPPYEVRKQVVMQEQQTPSRAALKRYLMTAIHLAIQTNDQKLCKQQKYISELERRVAKLEQFERKVDVLKFEREVKLQTSPKKVKNFSMRTAPINGDDAYDEPVITPREGQDGRGIRFFVNPHKKGPNYTNPNGQQTHRYQQYAQLQQTCTLLKQRLQIQNEARAEQTAQRQSLERKVLELQQENKALLTDLTSLEERLRFNQQKYADLQLFLHAHKSRTSGKIHHNFPPNITSELAAITNELRLCGVDRYQAAERQMWELMIARGLLRDEVTELQGKIVGGCKFSCTHREVFLLKEKLAASERQCRNYHQQLQDMRGQSRILPSQDKTVGQSSSCLQWGRLVYFCVSTAVARLQALLKQPKAVGRI